MAKKQAQFDFEGISIPTSTLDTKFPTRQPFPNEEETLLVLDDFNSDEDDEFEEYQDVDEEDEDEDKDIEVEEEDPESASIEFSFEMPLFPGAEDQNDLAISDIDVDEEEIEVENDPWKWTHPTFEKWFATMLNGVPKHSGQDILGIERAIGYLEAVLKEAPKALRTDIHGVINVSNVEKMRDEGFKGLDRLYERLEQLEGHKYPNKKRVKKGEANNELVKQAGSTVINGITVTVPLLVSAICRIAINSSVSAGRDIEDVFDKLAKKYKLTDREELEALQLLSDMGWPMQANWYRGTDRGDEVSNTSPDNFDFIQQFPG